MGIGRVAFFIFRKAAKKLLPSKSSTVGSKQTGDKFKMPDPLFGKAAYSKLADIAVNEYRKITFDVSNPKMANKKKFPKYSKGYAKQKKSGSISVMGGKTSVAGGYENSTAPFVRGDLHNDTKGDFSVKDNSVYIGWNAHVNKIDWLRDGGRILTSKSHPVNPDVVKKMMPQLNKELKKTMPKGTNTITIGKKK